MMKVGKIYKITQNYPTGDIALFGLHRDLIVLVVKSCPHLNQPPGVRKPDNIVWQVSLLVGDRIEKISTDKRDWNNCFEEVTTK